MSDTSTQKTDDNVIQAQTQIIFKLLDKNFEEDMFSLDDDTSDIVNMLYKDLKILNINKDVIEDSYEIWKTAKEIEDSQEIFIEKDSSSDEEEDDKEQYY